MGTTQSRQLCLSLSIDVIDLIGLVNCVSKYFSWSYDRRFSLIISLLHHQAHIAGTTASLLISTNSMERRIHVHLTKP